MANKKHNLVIRQYWRKYVDSLPKEIGRSLEDYQAWSFGNTPEMADELGELVRQGKKTATASLVWLFEEGIEPYPKVGDYHIILNGQDLPICIIQTTELSEHAFNEVGEEHAFLEGEGDRSLRFWREAHWAFFSEECRKLGREPDTQMPVLCEKFRLVYLKMHDDG
jgi:uncharacterized protein YhfF